MAHDDSHKGPLNIGCESYWYQIMSIQVRAKVNGADNFSLFPQGMYGQRAIFSSFIPLFDNATILSKQNAR